MKFQEMPLWEFWVLSRVTSMVQVFLKRYFHVLDHLGALNMSNSHDGVHLLMPTCGGIAYGSLRDRDISKVDFAAGLCSGHWRLAERGLTDDAIKCCVAACNSLFMLGLLNPHSPTACQSKQKVGGVLVQRWVLPKDDQSNSAHGLTPLASLCILWLILCIVYPTMPRNLPWKVSSRSSMLLNGKNLGITHTLTNYLKKSVKLVTY